jgi:acrylyl-CoA reductase (NADPH)
MDLPTSVAPFILRGVSLLGINSVTTPQTKRRAAWARLARELDLDKLASMTRRVSLEEVGRLGPEILAGRIRGRTVVEVG